MKRIAILPFCGLLFWVLEASCTQERSEGSGQSLSGEAASPEEMKKWRAISESEATWQRLAVSIDRWVGKRITLQGWLDYEMSYAEGNETSLQLFESPWAMKHKLRGRAVAVSSRAIEKACKNPVQSSPAVVRMLKGKLVTLTGVCLDASREYYICELDGPIELEVSRTQATFKIPENLLEVE